MAFSGMPGAFGESGVMTIVRPPGLGSRIHERHHPEQAAGVDVGLDLNPPTIGLMAQLRFLEEHCARNESVDFSAAVEALYKRLREGRT